METTLSILPSLSPREMQRGEGSSRAYDHMVEERQASQSQSASPSRVEPRRVEAAAGRLNQALDSLNRDLAISVHEDSGRLVVEVTDPGTGEGVRQIPAEQVLEVEESIDKIVGLFVNDIA